MRTLTLLGVLASLFVGLRPGWCQAPAGEIPAVSFVDLIGGKTAPLSLKLKDLTGEWRRFTTGENAGGMESLMAMRAGGAPSTGPAYFTRGLTVTLGTETFLVAYRQESKPFDFRQAIMHNDEEEMPHPDPLTADTILQLSLLNLRNIGNILDVSPFDLEHEVAAGKALQDELLRNKSANQLRQITIGMLSFAQDNDEILPVMNDLQQAIEASNLDEKVWKHPVTGEFYQVNTGIGGKALGDFEDPSEAVLCFEVTPWPDGKRYIAFLDGHVELMPEAEWAAVKQKAGIQ